MTITLPLTWLPGSIKCGPGDTEEAELGLTWQGRQTDRWSQPMANEVKGGLFFGPWGMTTSWPCRRAVSLTTLSTRSSS